MDEKTSKELLSQPPVAEPEVTAENGNSEEPINLSDVIHQQPKLLSNLQGSAQADLVSSSASVYIPQVEAISPPVEETQEALTLKASKEQLVSNITKTDDKITELQNQIKELKIKEQQLEEETKKPSEENTIPLDVCTEIKHQNLAQIIYTENKKKAEASEALLEKFIPKRDMDNVPLLGPNSHLQIDAAFLQQKPIYNQPSDTPVYHENKSKHINFKPRLVLHLKKQNDARIQSEKQDADRHDQLMQEWTSNLESIERKRRVRDQATLASFKNDFPTMEKQQKNKEDEEKLQKHNAVARAVVPPLLLDKHQKKLSVVKFLNNNGKIEDAKAEYQNRKHMNVWTDQEKSIFVTQYVIHPKDFVSIASFLERKSVSDCVEYYYLNKKKCEKIQKASALLKVKKRNAKAGKRKKRL